MNIETIDAIKNILNVITEHKETVEMLLDNAKSMLNTIYPLAITYLLIGKQQWKQRKLEIGLNFLHGGYLN